MSDLYKKLLHKTQIKKVSAIERHQRILQETSQLQQLKQHEPSYLNMYDQLFRHISLVLLKDGYDLTNYQPHQVLKAYCYLHQPMMQVNEMISQRHALKKNMISTLCKENQNTLKACLAVFEALQACNQ